MRISATVKNTVGAHEVSLDTGGCSQRIEVPAKTSGRGSAVNGGEFLMLALATCYCNDLYREAARLGIAVDAVEVQAEADFEGTGLAARNVRYRARVMSSAAEKDIARLLEETDAVAEIPNTLRRGAEVTLQPWSKS